MIKLWQLIFHGCAHKWRATSQSTFRNEWSSGPVVFVCCEKCGRRRSFNNSTMGSWERKNPPPTKVTGYMENEYE